MEPRLQRRKLKCFAELTLASFKRPKKVIFGELPKTATGKIQKYELRGSGAQRPTKLNHMMALDWAGQLTILSLS